MDNGNYVTVDADDNGEAGTSDQFRVTVSQTQGGAPICTAGGTLVSGNYQFHPTN